MLDIIIIILVYVVGGGEENNTIVLQGFTPDLMKMLHESSRHTGDYQMKYLLETMLERKEVTAADVLTRVNFIIKGWHLIDDLCSDGMKHELSCHIFRGVEAFPGVNCLNWKCRHGIRCCCDF